MFSTFAFLFSLRLTLWCFSTLQLDIYSQQSVFYRSSFRFPKLKLLLLTTTVDVVSSCLLPFSFKINGSFPINSSERWHNMNFLEYDEKNKLKISSSWLDFYYVVCGNRENKNKWGTRIEPNCNSTFQYNSERKLSFK